jgi:hypothetical protein
MKHRPLITLMLGTVILLGLLSALTPASSEASPRLLPPRPEDVVTSGGKSGGDGGDRDARPVGAYIELHVPGAAAGTWTVVQWQDSADDWHDIEGWRGQLDANGRKKWWVAARDFGSGPFRWQVIAGREGQPLATSEQFNLPGVPGEILLIEVSLGQ